jgi:hypothetical protein
MPRIPYAAACIVMFSLAAASGQAEVSDAFAASVTPLPAAESLALKGEPASVPFDAALGRKQDYLIILQPVQVLLETVAKESGLRIALSDNVKGVLRNLRATGTTAEVLDAVCANLGLDWFAFNGIIHVSTRSEATTRMVKLGDLVPEQAVDALSAAGLPLTKLEVRPTSIDNVLAMSGPPELLAIAEAVIEGIPPHVASTPKSAPLQTVLVRRGNDAHWETLHQ